VIEDQSDSQAGSALLRVGTGTTEGLARHRWFTRTFWPIWFAGDNVFPSPDHVPFLHRHFEPVQFTENRGKVPYIPFLRMPYYTFIGRKREDDESAPQPNDADA
jgi:hypothetical protein